MRYKKTAILLGSLLAAYAVLGFLLLPPFLKPRLVRAIEESTGRTVALEGLRTNPFTLSATLRGFHLRDRDTVDLVRFSELYVNYEVSSLWRNAYVFSALEVDTPYVAVRILAGGTLSVQDIVDRYSADTTAAGPSAGPPAGLVIDHFVIRQGTIFYEDLSRTKPMRRDIDSLDLFLSNFTTMPDRTGDYEFEANTASGEYLHWRGSLSVTPLRSQGFLELKHLRALTLSDFLGDRLKFRVDSGMLDLSSNYTFDGSRDTVLFRLSTGSASIRDLVLADPTDSLPPLVLPSVVISGVAFAFPEQAAVIDRITLNGGSLRTAYTDSGKITIQELLTPLPGPAGPTRSRMSVKVGEITTTALDIVFREQMQEPEAVFDVSGLALAVKNLCYGTPGTASINAKAVLNGGGSVEVSGTFSLQPENARLDLRVRDTPLPAFQTYATRYSRASLDAGRLSTRGILTFSTRGQRSLLDYRGSVRVDQARISDPVMKEDLLRWERLDLKEMVYHLSPPSLAIAEILARQPYARVVIGPDRMANVQHVMAGDDTTSRTGDPGTARGTRGSTLTTIGVIRFEDGSMNFSDLSLTPNFSVGILELGGQIRGLSSEQLARADVDLVGKVDRYAPVTIRGQINPLSEQAYTDVLLKFEGIDLTTFTPYSGKFAGYTIDRGKMNLDLRYRLNKRFLEGENKVVLDQLTLGEKIDGPDVTSLPVKLAVALLKDSHGVIDLDIPVSGSLDDPEFSFFPLILKVVMNLLWKLVTAPFALLGSLFGGSGDDLQFVAFSPGSDSLAADQSAKLETVVKGLVERPGLDLDIRGTTSPTVDREALAEAKVLGEIRRSGQGPLTAAETERLLALYRRTFSEDPAGLVPEGSLEEEERAAAIRDAARRRLVASASIGDEELRTLAQRRAARVREHLSAAGGIDPARIFLQDVDIKVDPTDGAVRTHLNLTAR